MRPLIPLLALCGLARADTQQYEGLPIRTAKIVLSARMCVYESGLRDARTRPGLDKEPPASWERIIAFTLNQIREAGVSRHPCSMRVVRDAMTCATSVWGKAQIPLSCHARHLYWLVAADLILPTAPDWNE